MRFLAALIAVALSFEAQAATLRTMTTLHGPNVYLSDLFDDAGRNAERLLGPGPAPGGRIVVEAPQLDAIARQYNVQWRSISEGDRAVLEWPGRPLTKDAVLDALRTAITATGDTADLDIDLPDFVPPTIPAEAEPVSTVSQLDLDKNTGRFSAILAVTGDAMNPLHMRLSGRIEEVVEAPVCVTRLLPETVIRAGDVRIGRIRKSSLQYGIARSIDRLVGMQLRRPVAAGMPVRLDDLVRPALVQRGAVVRLELKSNDLYIAGQAVALEAVPPETSFACSRRIRAPWSRLRSFPPNRCA
ncbi:MAG: flagellar basal body P-ring formation chaperone FlgA [Rhodopila sp.]